MNSTHTQFWFQIHWWKQPFNQIDILVELVETFFHFSTEIYYINILLYKYRIGKFTFPGHYSHIVTDKLKLLILSYKNCCILYVKFATILTSCDNNLR